MSKKILICDDSGIARKQLARVLPTEWDAQVEFATNGQEAVDIIQASTIDVLFLDLNMPVMDGYQTLEALQSLTDVPQVIVVSGDVQAQAVARVKALGAIDFLQKPVNSDTLQQALDSHQLLQDSSTTGLQLKGEAAQDFSLNQCLQEVTNVAMGRALYVDQVRHLNVLAKNHRVAVTEINIQLVAQCRNKGANQYR